MKPNKWIIVSSVENAIELLNKSPNFAVDFVRLKMEFFRNFQTPLIFSTRFGAEFFDTTAYHLRTKTPLRANVGEILGDYDVKFNKFLTISS
jgi:hypothetical protein